MKKLAVVLLCGVGGLNVVMLVAWWCSPAPQWETVGPVQVLTNGDETSVFFQFDTWKRRPGLFVSDPNVIIAKRQGVVQIRDGDAKEYRLGDSDGPTFGPNTSYIFHHDGHFLLLEEFGLNRGDALYRWTGGASPRFDRLDDATMRGILHEEGLGHPYHEPRGSLQPRHEGWRRVASDYCRPSSSPLRFADSVLSFDRSSFTLTLPHPPFKLILR
jgi:hypothetical protein